MGMARDVAGMIGEAGGDRDPAMQSRVDEIIAESYEKGRTSPDTANRILREMRRFTGVSDPYRRFKGIELQRAREIYEALDGTIGSDLRSRVTVAALGNSLDFFTSPEDALALIPDMVKTGVSFFRDGISRLERFLNAGPGTVLYLSDNSGEIFFDIPLYRYVRDRSERAVLVVKGRPSLNDLTRAELHASQLEAQFDAISDTGTDGVGIDWERIPADFSQQVHGADLIISKGMANFETIYGRNLPVSVFFLFKAKCRPIQNYLDVPPDSYCAIWQDATGP